MDNLDKYGGWKDLSFRATGFFRLEKTEKRWWLVTPSGNAFLSHGVNHVERKWMERFYNEDFWANKYHPIEDPGTALSESFIAKVKEDLDHIGWNTLGCHSPQRYYPKSFIPYVKTLRFVETQHYVEHTEKDFPDVFHDDFAIFCDEKAATEAAPLKDDPFLLGYSLTDCPIFTNIDAASHDHNIYGWKRKRQPTWPEVLRNLGADSPGKKEYVKIVSGLYNKKIRDFNQVYGTSFKSFKELERSVDWRPRSDISNKMEERDDRAFLLRVIDKCYEVESAAIRKHDPNHLVLGDKLNGNTDTPKEIIEVAAKHFDLIFFQYYAFWKDLEPWLDRCAAATGGNKPLFHGDAAVSVPNTNMPDPFGPQCKDQYERVEKFKELYYNAFKRTDFVGWNWCGWMDSWEVGGQIGKQHSGIQDPFGLFHPVGEALKEFSGDLYTF